MTSSQFCALISRCVTAFSNGAKLRKGMTIAIEPMVNSGKYEVNTHHSNITTKVVNRWEHENNKELVKQANRFFEIMGDYNHFWRY